MNFQIRKITAGIFALNLFLITLPVVTLAQTPSSTNQATSNRIQVWCSKTVPRIAVLLTNSTNSLPKRQQFVATRKQNLQNRINKLQQRGANVTQLTADFNIYSGMMDKWVADFQIYISDLQAVQQYDCGTSKGAFANAIKIANTAHKQIGVDLRAFRSYYKNTLMVDFKTARQTVAHIKKPKTAQ